MKLWIRCCYKWDADTNAIQLWIRCSWGSDDTHSGLDSIAAITKKIVGKTQSVSKGSTNLWCRVRPYMAHESGRKVAIYKAPVGASYMACFSVPWLRVRSSLCAVPVAARVVHLENEVTLWGGAQAPASVPLRIIALDDECPYPIHPPTDHPRLARCICYVWIFINNIFR